jgi:ribosomal protein S18 acetylase RimI-like enzyme
VKEDVALMEWQAGWIDELIPRWRASFEDGVGITDPHPLAEQRDYFVNKLIPNFSVRVAVVDGQTAGFVAASRESIAQLYVWIDHQHRGIGTRLLNWAKQQSAGTLWLYTFAQNRRACAFYERNGFVAVARGFEPTWQLADVRYEWSSVA